MHDDPRQLIFDIANEDLRKLYLLMVLSGVPASRANYLIFNIKNSDTRAGSVEIRNMLIRILKKMIARMLEDPILYQRARTLAIHKDLSVFEEVKNELKDKINESEMNSILKRLLKINNKSNCREIATNIVNMMSEMDTSSGIAGLPPDEPIIKRKGAKMIVRRGKMVGNPSYVVEADAYAKALNGLLPEEISEALDETGIVVLENKDTEQMVFLFAEARKGPPTNMDAADYKLGQNTEPEGPKEIHPDDEEEEAKVSLRGFEEIRRKRMIASGMSPEEAEKKAKAPLKHRGDNPGKG